MTLLPTQTQCRSSVKLHCYADDTQLYLAVKAEETQQSEELQAGPEGVEPDLLKGGVQTTGTLALMNMENGAKCSLWKGQKQMSSHAGGSRFQALGRVKCYDTEYTGPSTQEALREPNMASQE